MTDLDLGPLEELPDAEPALRKSADGRRFVCVRRGDAVAVLDDRCPHEGYPLSGGAVKDGVLTCCWHNWKFELETGACVFGGEAVRRYPVRIEAGRVRIDARIDPVAERARLDESLRAGLRDGSMGSVMRDGLRLAALDGSLEGALGVVASDAARRAPWGFEHGLAMLADVSAWIAEGLVDGAAAFAAVTSHVAEPLLHAPLLPPAGGSREARARPTPPDRAATDLLAALKDERREDAAALARALAADPDALVERALVPHLAADLTDYGHGAIYALKARELAARFPTHAADLWASAITAIGWATIDSALPGWTATHEGVRAVARADDGHLDDRAAYEAALLSSERDAVAACLARLDAGVAPRALLLASAHAAAERLRRFDDAWQERLDAPVTILDVSHALTFTEAALGLTDGAGLDVARFAVQSAAFVGKLQKANPPSRPREEAGGSERAPNRHWSTHPPSLSETHRLQTALANRDLPAALAALTHPEADDPAAAFWPTVARFALHDAFVRPIFAAHAVKTTEACRRLEALDPDGAPTYRAALITLLVPRRPERFFERTAAIAERFLDDGRPPPGLY